MQGMSLRFRIGDMDLGKLFDFGKAHAQFFPFLEKDPTFSRLDASFWLREKLSTSRPQWMGSCRNTVRNFRRHPYTHSSAAVVCVQGMECELHSRLRFGWHTGRTRQRRNHPPASKPIRSGVACGNRCRASRKAASWPWRLPWECAAPPEKSKRIPHGRKTIYSPIEDSPIPCVPHT